MAFWSVRQWDTTSMPFIPLFCFIFLKAYFGDASILERLIKIDGLTGLWPTFTAFEPLRFFHDSNGASAIVTVLGTSSFFLWLLEVFRIWKEANLIPCSQNPAVCCPLCKLPVNEWAGHPTPWGSTSGSSDHQLLCLELIHAPVSMMNPECKCKCKALTLLYVPLPQSP